MHGLTVSVAAKLTPLRRAAVQTCTSLSLSMSPFFDRVEEEEEERDLEFRNDRNFPELLFLFFRVFVSKIEREIDLNFAAELERSVFTFLPEA